MWVTESRALERFENNSIELFARPAIARFQRGPVVTNAPGGERQIMQATLRFFTTVVQGFGRAPVAHFPRRPIARSLRV